MNQEKIDPVDARENYGWIKSGNARDDLFYSSMSSVF